MWQHGKGKYGDITVKYPLGPVLQAHFQRFAEMAAPGLKDRQNNKRIAVLWLNNH